MNSLVLRLVKHRMPTRELVRERSRLAPDFNRIVALRSKRLKVKLAVMRHLPRSGMALKLARQIVAEIGGRTKHKPGRNKPADDSIGAPPC
ncbi:hypothetical protein [Sphingobium olei]|uniref:Transposase n=1 Tax=Sphingobium olei TaxID=420955 RepID=A0ABW3NX45_9SPHN